ncbi:hypothetical protein BC941DRAFT_476409 [Chlamydoabsidia padenii]|nr:hypothetical protein BC941DRAFT_476409 [Chlamydoabsidia padenii]
MLSVNNNSLQKGLTRVGSLPQSHKYAPIWGKVTEHTQNNKFNVDHLLEVVCHTSAFKRNNNHLIDDWELEAMVSDLHYYL